MLINRIIEEISDRIVDVFENDIRQAGESYERTDGEADPYLWVVRRFIRAVLRKSARKLGL